MSSSALYREIFSMELRRISAYRVDFWLSTIASIGAQVGVAYYLWSSIFENRGVTHIEGLTFSDLMFYYVIAATMGNLVTGGANGNFWREIYDGSLTRYLVYPCSIFPFKIIRCIASAALDFVLLLAGVALVFAITGPGEHSHISLLSIGMALVSSFFAILLYFSMSAILEFIGFWADNIWSLIVMLQIMGNLFGGGMIPLRMFPEWAQEILFYLPFPYTISAPTKAFLGQLSVTEWLSSIGMSIAWTLLLFFIGRCIWRRGLRQYSGVGM